MSERRYYERDDDDYREEYRESKRRKEYYDDDSPRDRDRDRDRERDRDRNGRRDKPESSAYGSSSAYGEGGSYSRYEETSRSSRQERDRYSPGPSSSSYNKYSKYDTDRKPYEPPSERSRYESSRKSSYDYDYEKPKASSFKSSYDYDERSPYRPSDEVSVKTERGKSRGGGGSRPGSTATTGRRGRNAIVDLIVTRPMSLNTKKGTTGSTVTLLANYFKILKRPEWNIYKYRVDYVPDVEQLAQKKQLMRRQITKLGSFQFDGSMLYSPYKYAQDPMILMDKDEKEKPVQISIRFVGELLPTDGQYNHLLNLIMRATIESLNMQRAYGNKGTKYFDAVQKIDIRAQSLQVWPGFCTAIRQHEKDIMICTELTHKVIRLENCYNVIQHYGRDTEAIKKDLIGKIVVTEYNNATYRIDDVDLSLSPNSSFVKKNGERTTFVQYFRDRYNCHIRDVCQPLLVSRAKSKDVRAGRPEILNLIPELCRLTGLTEDMRSNFKLMRDLAQHTRVRPDMRVKRFLELNRRIQHEERARDVLTKWEMQLDRHLVEFPARVLPTEVICFGDRREEKPMNADWTSAVQRNKLFEADKIYNWHCICTNRDYQVVNKFLGNLVRTARNSGVHMSEPRIIRIDNTRVQEYIGGMEEACNDSTQLIMLVVPNQDANRYSSIKKKACVERAIPTQCVLTRVMANEKILRSVSVKIMVQMNCKLGNVPWTVKIPASGIMTVGFDVTFDARDKRKSYGALVATMDLRQCNSYYSTVSQHAHGEEMSNFLVVNMMKALRQYQTIHQDTPKRIIFYRDGVSDGDLNHVLEYEVKKLANDLKSAYGETAPKLTFIIVSKRINTRLFSKIRGSDITNAPPGTVVDDVITLPERYDFFIVSQSTKEGTISPTSYNVIWDESGLSADRIQIWTYKMTHLYYNWSGNVKVPAVCQYAQKLAFLVGQFIHQEPSQLLEKQLYFL
ncbi:hypothetical protein DMENIID0001_010870 [Sergentomyia squamirostris]